MTLVQVNKVDRGPRLVACTPEQRFLKRGNAGIPVVVGVGAVSFAVAGREVHDALDSVVSVEEGSRGGVRSLGRHSDMPLGETRRRLTPTSRSSLTEALSTKPNMVDSDTLRTRSSHDHQPGQRFKREWSDASCRLPLQQIAASHPIDWLNYSILDRAWRW